MKRFQMDGFQGHFVFHIEMQSTGKCITYIFGYLLPMTSAKDYIFEFNCRKLVHAPLPKLVSTDPLGFVCCYAN